MGAVALCSSKTEPKKELWTRAPYVAIVIRGKKGEKPKGPSERQYIDSDSDYLKAFSHSVF